MNRTIRITVSALVIVVMAMTAQLAAQMRTAPSATGMTMVLCTGSGPLVVQMDADGQPIDPSHVCPDCAFALFAFDLPDHSLEFEPVYSASLFQRFGSTRLAPHEVAVVRARDPPVFV